MHYFHISVSRMHATATALRDGKILLIGGRLSPAKLCTQLVAVDVQLHKEFHSNNNIVSDCKTGDRNSGLQATPTALEKEACKSSSIFKDTSTATENMDKENLKYSEDVGASSAKAKLDSFQVQADLSSPGDNELPVAMTTDCDIRSKEKNCVAEVRCSLLETTGDIPCPRWRHTAIVYEDKGIVMFIQQ